MLMRFFNNAPPLPGGGAAIASEAPAPVWSTARNGLMSHGSAPTTSEMMQGASIGGLQSGVRMVGRSNGTVNRSVAREANNAYNLTRNGRKVYDWAKGRMGGGGEEAAAEGGATVAEGGTDAATMGATGAAVGGEAAAMGGEAALAGGAAAAGGEAAAAGGAMAAAGGLEAAGLAADSTGVGIPVGVALAVVGAGVAAFGLLHHHKKSQQNKMSTIAQNSLGIPVRQSSMGAQLSYDNMRARSM